MKVVILFVLFWGRSWGYFNPHLESSVELVCYQCRAYSHNGSQKCDEASFKGKKEVETIPYLFQCPYYQSSFCFKKASYYPNYVEYVRGCSGPVDVRGHMMKSGCVTLQSPRQIEVCLCNEHKCNFAPQSDALKPLVLFMFISTIKLF